MSPYLLLERDQSVGLVELIGQTSLPVVVPFYIVDRAHLVGGFEVNSCRFQARPIQFWLSASPCRLLVDSCLSEITHLGFGWLESSSHLGCRRRYGWVNSGRRLQSYRLFCFDLLKRGSWSAQRGSVVITQR